jgi:hypothetical protein
MKLSTVACASILLFAGCGGSAASRSDAGATTGAGAHAGAGGATAGVSGDASSDVPRDVSTAIGDATLSNDAPLDSITSDAPPSDSATPDASAATSICGPEGWCWLYPHPQGNPLRTVWAIARDDVWAGGALGTVLHYDGKSWQSVDVPTGHTTVNSIWASGPNDVWLAGEPNLLLRFDGKTWTHPFPGSFLDEPLAIRGTGPDDVWVTMNDQTLHWNGTAFGGGLQEATNPFNGASVWARSRSYAVMGCYDGNATSTFVERMTTNAFALTPQPIAPTTTHLFAAGGATPNDGWLGGTDGAIYHVMFVNDSPFFTKIPSAATATLHGVWGASANDVWAVGEGATITHWNGTAWSAVASPSRFDLYAVAGTATDDVWAVGDGGVILHWDGTTWTRDDRPTEENLNGVWASANDDLWAVGDNGTILRSSDGATFAPVASPTTQNLQRIWAAAANDVFIVGDGGTVLEWTGATFKTFPALRTDLEYIWGTAHDDVWVTGQALYHFDGVAFTEVAAPESTNTPYAAWPVDKTRVFITGGIDNLYDYNPMTKAFTKTVVQGAGVIWGRSATDIWVANGNGDGDHFDGTKWNYTRTDAHYAIWGGASGDTWGVGFFGALDHHAAPEGFWSTTAQNLRMTNTNFLDVHGTSATDLWAVGENGTIVHLGK